jgi:hypothetical protein
MLSYTSRDDAMGLRSRERWRERDDESKVENDEIRGTGHGHYIVLVVSDRSGPIRDDLIPLASLVAAEPNIWYGAA